MVLRPITLDVDGELRLEQYSERIAPEIFNLIDRNRPHLSQNGDITSSKYPTLDSLVLTIREPPKPLEKRFAIYAENNVVGVINVTPDTFGAGEVGYFLGEEFQEKGYVSRALLRIIDYAREELGLSELFADIKPANLGSQAVVFRCGFRESSRAEDNVRYRLKL